MKNTRVVFATFLLGAGVLSVGIPADACGRPCDEEVVVPTTTTSPPQQTTTTTTTTTPATTTSTTTPPPPEGPEVQSSCVNSDWVITNTGGISLTVVFNSGASAELEPGESVTALPTATGAKVIYGASIQTLFRPLGCTVDVTTTTPVVAVAPPPVPPAEQPVGGAEPVNGSLPATGAATMLKFGLVVSLLISGGILIRLSRKAPNPGG